MGWKLVTALILIAAGAGRSTAALSDAELSASVQTIKQVGGKGAGHAEAQAAWRKLASADAAQLPTLLAALDDASPLAANWLRAAAEVIVSRKLAAREPLPTTALQRFLADRSHAPRSRRMVYGWLVRIDPTTSERLLPGMLDDPSLDLRRDAVSRLLDQAKPALTSDPAHGRALLEQALRSARDLDQIRLAIDQLKQVGVTVDISKQLGFLRHWKVVGPLDNVGGRGFNKAYPPEEKVDLKAHYEGQTESIGWVDARANDDMGHVDLNEALGQHKGAVAYCYVELESPVEQPVELRLGTEAANKIWLNGKLLEDAEVYHALTDLDQYVGRGQLKRGTNQVLLKICQNEQTEDWAANWKFQIRACDASGGAIELTEKTP